MATDKKEYVNLRPLPIGEVPQQGEPVTYDTLGKAVEALDDLGMCMNWAILTPVKATVKDLPLITLLYEGWTYRHSFERFVVLPFEVDAPRFEHHFEELLRKVFEPFVSFDDMVHHSLISVVQGRDWAKQECFLVTLVLHFTDEKGEKGETQRAIQEALTKVEDGHDDVSSKVFWLD